MADGQPTLESLVAELAQMRAILATLNETIARQESAIATLQGKLEAADNERSPSATVILGADADNAYDATTSNQGGHTTSRRGLLRGAAAGAAAAAVAAVAVGGVEQAHAAPLADGGSMLLGNINSASGTTQLNDAAGTSSYMLHVLSYSTNQPAAAIYGSTSGGGAGVLGDSYGGSGGLYVPGVGVEGNSRNGTGVLGTDLQGGVGVEAATVTGIGTYTRATGSGGQALVATATDSSDIVAGGTGLISQAMQTVPGAPSGSFLGGESIRDSNGDLWLCTAGGSPGTWVKVAHAVAGYSGGAITYLSKPIRLLDTRGGATDANLTPNAPCQPGVPLTVSVANVNFRGVQVPSALAGAIGNVTAVLPTAAGYVALVPSGVGLAGTSNVNYIPSQIVPNFFTVSLTSGKLDVIVDPNSNPVDVLIDLFAVVA